MKKFILILFSIIICICSIVGYVNYSEDKKVIKNIVEEKRKRDSKLICYNETDEANINVLYKFDKDGIVKDNVKYEIFSTVSDTSNQYKQDVEEYFRNKFCDEYTSNCNFVWNNNDVTLTYNYNLPEEYIGLNNSKIKEKIKEKKPEYKCK